MPENDQTAKVVIKDEENLGRYLVAGNDIQAGDVVLSEYPIVAGPLYTRSKLVCLQCLKLVGEESYRCTNCSFPLCDETCQNGSWHAAECKLFKKANFQLQVDDWSAFNPIYSCIAVLRTLLLKETNPDGWEIIDSLMDHDKERSEKDSPSWRVHELLVVTFINKSLGLLQFSTAEIRRVVGILRTNSVKLETRFGFGEGIAVFPTYSFANHSCLCNTHTRKFKDLKLELIAQTPIKKGDIVWTRYTTPQIGNFQRISDIQRTWHFQCSCSRCQDPTEFGTMMSGLMCGENCSGILLPRVPNLLGSPWGCSVCKKRIGVLAVNKIIKGVTDDIGANREQSNQQLLGLITKYGDKVLHRNHYLLLGIKEVVLQRLMAVLASKDRFSALPAEEKLFTLQTRTRLFREIVDLLKIVDSPGAPWVQKLEKMERDELALRTEYKL